MLIGFTKEEVEKMSLNTALDKLAVNLSQAREEFSNGMKITYGPRAVEHLFSMIGHFQLAATRLANNDIINTEVFVRDLLILWNEWVELVETGNEFYVSGVSCGKR